MSLFILQAGLWVVTKDDGGLLLRVGTGDARPLSPLDLELLARATTGGLPQGHPGFAPLQATLAGLGLVLPEQAAPGQAVAPLAGAGEPPADGPVPLFRLDLRLLRRGASAVFDATDPATGLSFALYDFELSVARMLDGRRTAAEVVAAAKQIGIPCDRTSLALLLERLSRVGFLAPAGAAPSTPAWGGTWQPRLCWNAGIRSLYQSALKEFRQGRYAEAVVHFKAMQARDPGSPEAAELLGLARQRLLAVLDVTTGAPAKPAPAALDPAPLAVASAFPRPGVAAPAAVPAAAPSLPPPLAAAPAAVAAPARPGLAPATTPAQKTAAAIDAETLARDFLLGGGALFPGRDALPEPRSARPRLQWSRLLATLVWPAVALLVSGLIGILLRGWLHHPRTPAVARPVVEQVPPGTPADENAGAGAVPEGAAVDIPLADLVPGVPP